MCDLSVVRTCVQLIFQSICIFSDVRTRGDGRTTDKRKNLQMIKSTHGLFIDQSHRGRSQIRVISSIVGFKRILFYFILYMQQCVLPHLCTQKHKHCPSTLLSGKELSPYCSTPELMRRSLYPKAQEKPPGPTIKSLTK